MSTTSLKLPDELKQRIAEAARRAGITPHAFMVAAIEQATASAETRAHFVAQAEAARKDMLDSGRGTTRRRSTATFVTASLASAYLGRRQGSGAADLCAAGARRPRTTDALFA